jgi:hypothetical protein
VGGQVDNDALLRERVDVVGFVGIAAAVEHVVPVAAGEVVDPRPP